MKSIRDRLGELARPTGEEDLMRVDYPAPRLQVSPRQAVWGAVALAGIVVVAVLCRMLAGADSGAGDPPIREATQAATPLGGGIDSTSDNDGTADPVGQTLPLPIGPEKTSSQSSQPVAPKTGETGADVVVSVVGHVAHPGLVVLPAGARVADALARAGVLEGSDPRAVNLARLLGDGEQIVVPAPGEPFAPAPAGPGAGDAATAAALGLGAPGDGSGAPGGKISINTAGVQELTSLSGVGEVTAQAIVAHREAHGPFRSVEELTEVRGIGPAKLDAIKDQVTP